MRKEILKDTLIVFQSDNGGKEGEDENQADNGRLKGGKGDVYDGGVRTPMFIHYPKQIAASSNIQTTRSIHTICFQRLPD